MNIETVIGHWTEAIAPPPDLTVSEWADERRRLPERSAAKGARWRTSDVPYLAGIMDAVHEPGIRSIALMKCAQSGGSEAINNILGYHIEHDPCAMLLVQPSEQVAEAWSKERLSDMLRGTPELAAIINSKRARGDDGESTLTFKLFPNGFLAMGGANTPNTFARWSVRMALADDYDRFPAEVGDEGDPGDLLENRTTTYYNSLTVFVSTPTLKQGRIDTLYRRSDQRRYVITCPDCARVDWIAWSDPGRFNVRYDDRDPDTARIECPDEEHGGCGARIDEPTRRLLLAEGFWKATATPIEPGRAGFHMPAMISTLGKVTLPSMVEKWLRARQLGPNKLRVFINTTLAEGYEERGVRVESHTLLAKRESYGSGVEVPAQCAFITAGVDVQADYFQVQVQAWGLAGERWVVDWRTIPGDPRRVETQQALLEALRRRYSHARGVDLPIHAVCVDTGYATEEMYDFVRAYQSRFIFATKGIGGKTGEPIVMKPNDRTYGKHARAVRLYPINVDDGKSDVLGSMQVLEAGPGKMHYPEFLDEEYFAQLCAEHKETKYNKGGVATHTVWIQDRERNEALDTAVLCLAAIRIMRPNIRQMHQAIFAATEPKESPASPAGRGQEPAKPAAVQVTKKPVQERRVSRSSYLSR